MPVAERPEYDDVLNDIRESGFNGIVAVSSAGDVDVSTFGVAERNSESPIDGDTVFDIGSITKQFTGAAILRLQMDGLVSVQDPIGNYLPGLPADKAHITLHQLLTHTAGLPDSIGDDYDPIDRETYITRVADLELDNPPGTVHEYSNVGYSLLGAVIETVTDESYETYLHTHLFQPAGMNDTGYVIPDWDARTVAVGYYDGEPVGRPDEQLWAEDGPYWNLRANGGILSTANDMLRWHEALLGDDVLDSTSKGLFYGTHVAEGPEETSFYGYGWAIFPSDGGPTLITHNGGNDVFFADFLRFVDDDLTIFLATNEADIRFEPTAFDIARSLLDFDVPGGGDTDCPIVGLDDYEDFQPVSELPDTAPANVADRLFTFFDTPPDQTSATAVASIVDRDLSPELAPGETPGALIAEALALQEELATSDIVDFIVIDDLTFGARLNGNDGAFVLHASLSEEEAPRVTCLSIEN